MKSIFHHFWRAFIEANKTIFFGRWGPDFKERKVQGYEVLTMKIIALDSFHSVLYKRVSNFFLTQVWVFYCKNLLFLPTKRLKYSFKSPTFSKILVSKKIWRRACRAKNCLIAHFFFYYSSKLLYSWPSIFTFYIYMLYIYLLYLFFLKILIWFDYVIDKKQIKKKQYFF